MNQANPESGVVDIISSILNSERAKAIDSIHDLLYAKASETLSLYKQSVANTFFDEPVETETDETDNGNN